MIMTPEQLTGQSQSHLSEVVIGQKAFLVHLEVGNDLLRLKQAATQAGFNLNIASGFRDFERQKTIWNNKILGHSAILDSDSQPIDDTTLSELEKVMAILRWSALPGGSRHHWGCEFDLFDRDLLPQGVQLKLEPWEYLQGHQTPFYQWLKDNLAQFGFFFPYADDLGGVAPEPWHISHKHTAHDCLAQFSPAILEQQLRLDPILAMEEVLSQLDYIYTQFITNICGEV
ncbi:D,D-carboxypeptidase-related protein [Vibrio scophthalmi LMG 19158]|uniref:D,D-carboxypeptidase-related protein n=2 Tax=Vibrio scophthalmi TaxID=45658 RepID=F9RTV2_9VIBR|nr:D,D-carboxypeptidase-related protein [Vibrio scophthalmi LMG 19158]